MVPQSDFARQWGQGATVYKQIVLDGGGPCLHGPAIRHFVQAVSAQLERLPKPHTLLDLASATGEPGFALAKAHPEASVTVSDFSEEMVSTAHSAAEQTGLSNVKCLVVDAADLSQFEDNSFSAITCSAGIFFVSDWKRALREWSRCLKPGGYLFLSAWQLREKVQLQKILGGLLPIIADMKGPGAPALNTHSDPQPLLAELEALGLDKIACREVNIPMTLPQRDISTFASMPPLGRIVAKFIEQDPANRQRVVEIVQKCAADNGCLRQDGAIHMTENLIHFISARKPVQA